nr:S9 family peptidase [Saprospiraceae bacterium]
GLISNTLFSPDASKAAFVYENNIYIRDFKKGKTSQVTKDGKKNHIINGMCDWVYEEEFSFTRAFEWSPDGNHLAFMRFDETKVPEFIMPMFEDGSHPRYERFKYPKVGDTNASVSLKIYNCKKAITVDAKIGDLTDMYLPRLKWTQNNNQVAVIKLNRLQNHLQLLLVDANKGISSVLMKEKSKYYIEMHDNLDFLEDGQHFIWTSEKNGFNSIYVYNMQGKEVRQLTQNGYDVLSVYGLDKKRNVVYFKASIDSPIDRQVYKVSLEGGAAVSITPAQGDNNVIFSPTFDYYSWNHNTINTPPVIALYNNAGLKLRVLQDNESLRTKMKKYQLSEVSFFKFNTSENVTLNAWKIMPSNFDVTKKYPVLIYQYSGPGSQEVTDGWMGSYYWWFQMLAQKGYMVVCVDPRGTGARGEEFRKMTYGQLGKYETMDMIESAKYLASLPYVDGSRIGIFGWSYGGYESCLAILKGNDVFKTAVAVAPVTNWKWYDSVYTERYMGTLKDNEAGYKNNSPVYFADQLKGNLLIAHGTADDNVHFQNSAEMFKELIKANKQFDSVVYTNRNHGIYGDNATIHLFTKITDFILTKL